ncbi:transcription factor E4F1 isoform X3 [Erinaceus europaeus]|uniref:Transcription factor E4F1 isoform X3 n=1 Tax=Erinaceus europaeus TaxID=9365 RepID=A0ABM3VW26_ERIEU|nr:transcription factor E4F1 isoform X3 [Erinaceus europaeus]
MEGAMAVRVTAAHTAGARAAAGRGAGEGGVAAAAAGTAGGFLGLPAAFSEEDEDDVHRCGRCQAEFTALEDFVQHKLQKGCQRAPQEALPATPVPPGLLGQEWQRQQEEARRDRPMKLIPCDTGRQRAGIRSWVVPAAADPEEPIAVAHIVVEAPDLVGSGDIKEVIVGAKVEPGDNEMAEAPSSPQHQGPGPAREAEQAPVKLLVNKEGRYVCLLCHKTFKTGSILKAHMVTHSSRKDHECKLCGACFRTKGSLIRHHRRHTDERPYKCAKCGKSFRESGALTRHLKSLTPCTEKIRFGLSKDSASREEVSAANGATTVGAMTSSSVTGEPVEASPVIHLVTDAKGTVIHEVHVQMQELPLGVKGLAPEPPDPEELPCSGEGSRENLLRQAMRNSGIVLERAGEEGALEPAPAAEPHPLPLGATTPGLPLLDVEQVETVGGGWPPREGPSAGPQATPAALAPAHPPRPVVLGPQWALCPQQVAGEGSPVPRNHPCPQCSETFPTAATLEAHKRDHAGPRLFPCAQCGKAFPKAYLLRKHQEVHVHERRFRCGDCGKLYKTIAHVRGHRRVHSDERPYPCPECGKRYKTKNAQQVHFRTHLEEKPHVCPFCSRGFREKGSLVRHVRHHTGEKPFKCYKCGRGFAEHGTLNRHLRTKGGCLLEVEELLVAEESPAVLADDPHTVLVEFSSMVADTQEYIIEAASDNAEAGEAAELIEGAPAEVDSHIMKVVQQIVHQAGAGHQIIVQNVTVDQEAGLGAEAAAADTITIATPESLTEQVAMTLASAISEGTVLTARAGRDCAEQATVTMVSSEDIEILEHAGELVIASPEGQLESLKYLEASLWQNSCPQARSTSVGSLPASPPHPYSQPACAMGTPRTLLVALWLLGAAAATGLRIGAFNIQSFSDNKVSNPTCSDVIPQILAGYDIVLVQEVRDPDLSAVTQLMEQLNSASEQAFGFLSSEPLGRDHYKEMYLFVYRKDTVSVVDTYQYPDPQDAFSREPFVVKFSTPSSAAQELVLVPLHAAPHQAVAEIDALYDVYLDLIDKWGTDDLVFLGDFNADCSYVRPHDWAAIRLRTSEVFKWLIPDSADTTVGNSDCAYDRIVVSGAHLRRSLKAQSAGVRNFQEEFGLDQAQALAISDHFPVEVTFKSH